MRLMPQFALPLTVLLLTIALAGSVALVIVYFEYCSRKNSFSKYSSSLRQLVFYSSGSVIGYNSGYNYTTDSSSALAVRGTFDFYFPVYEIIPDSISGDTTYNTTTRPTSITGGNYGVVGDNNEITKVEDNSTIINETNNTYYNPATGTTVPIVDWSYDYSDRSYKVTLENGDTATVT